MTTAELNKLKKMSDEELNEYFMSKFTFLSKGYVGLYRKVKYKGKLVPIYRPTEKSVRKYIDKCNAAKRYITCVYKMLEKRNSTKSKISRYVDRRLRRAYDILRVVLKGILAYKAVLSKYPKYLRKCSVEEVNKYFIDKFIKDDLSLPPKKKYKFEGKVKEFRKNIPLSPSERRLETERLKETMCELTKVYRGLGFIYSARSHTAKETAIYKAIIKCSPYVRLRVRYTAHKNSLSGHNIYHIQKDSEGFRYNQRFYNNLRRSEGRNTSGIQFFNKQERKVANAKKTINRVA
jgi:hypothetical protein